MRTLVCLALLAQQARADDPDDLPAPASRYWFGIGAGVAGHDARAHTGNELVATLAFGVPLGNRQQVVASVESSQAHVDDLPASSHTASLVGLRSALWPPKRFDKVAHLPGRFIDVTALYLTVVAGWESRKVVRYEMDERLVTRSSGHAIGFGAGYMALQGSDWGFSIEVSGRLTNYEDGNELTYGYAFVAYLMK